jgi:hypothetical protein
MLLSYRSRVSVDNQGSNMKSLMVLRSLVFKVTTLSNDT